MAIRASVLVAALLALALPAAAHATEPWATICGNPGNLVLVPVEGEEHVMDATCSFDLDGHDIVLYEWDLDGDGDFDTARTTPRIRHTFTDRGSHVDAMVGVGLRITDTAGEVGTWTIPIRITDAINSWFRFEPQLVNPGDVVSLAADVAPVALTSPFLPAPELTYDWDLDGDGSFETTSGLIPSATLTAPDAIGRHPVRLRVSDDHGNVSTILREIEVLPRHPSRDQQPWAADANLGKTPVLELQEKELRDALAPAVVAAPDAAAPPASTPVDAAQPRRPKLRAIDANRNGLSLRYTGGPKWSRWKVVVRLPADRAAQYGLPRKTVVLARGALVFDGRGVGRSRMRWTPGAYKLFRQVRQSTVDIMARRVA